MVVFDEAHTLEGVAAVRMPDGATRIYILSDDNYSSRQRTLLYAFDLVEDADGAD